MNLFNHSSRLIGDLQKNGPHQFAMNHTMMLYKSNSLYTFIPKNGCSTMRLSVAISNGCIDGFEAGHWIHANNKTFNASLAEAIRAEYSFVILRCPYRRLASVFLDKFISKEPQAWGYRDLRNREFSLDDLTFKSFVTSLQKPKIKNSNTHWRPQSNFLLYKEYSDYFCLEDFPLVISTLKDKLSIKVIDARNLTDHGTDKLELVNNLNFSEIAAFDISLLKRQGQCPTHAALYTEELAELVSKEYAGDIKLYQDRFGSKNLLFN